MQKRRVVVTGLGVVAPNAIGRENFEEALRQGKSGIRFIPELEELKFASQIAGVPQIPEGMLEEYFTSAELKSLKSSGIAYAVIAGMDAWKDAGLVPAGEDDKPDWTSGCIFGSGMTGVEPLRYGIDLVDAGKVRRLGGRMVEQGMASGPSAYLGGKIGLGNRVSSNSAACATGTEAVILGWERIFSGLADRMLVGSADSKGPYVWGSFDSLRVLQRKFNDHPEAASRPMSTTAGGFVAGAGAGALVLESLDSAQKRGAHIYAEIKGGAVNSGGQRGNGSMTAPNAEGVERCIKTALTIADVHPDTIDAISGHLTATMGDPQEVRSWVNALGRSGEDFPYIQSLKSLIGHCLSAAGSIECVASVLQLHGNFFHLSANSEDLHPDISSLIAPGKVPQTCLNGLGMKRIAKASFGFGDVNACVILDRWEE